MGICCFKEVSGEEEIVYFTEKPEPSASKVITVINSSESSQLLIIPTKTSQSEAPPLSSFDKIQEIDSQTNNESTFTTSRGGSKKLIGFKNFKQLKFHEDISTIY